MWRRRRRGSWMVELFCPINRPTTVSISIWKEGFEFGAFCIFSTFRFLNDVSAQDVLSIFFWKKASNGGSSRQEDGFLSNTPLLDSHIHPSIPGINVPTTHPLVVSLQPSTITMHPGNIRLLPVYGTLGSLAIPQPHFGTARSLVVVEDMGNAFRDTGFPFSHSFSFLF